MPTITISIRKPAPVGCLTQNGQEIYKGPYALAKYKMKEEIAKGVPAWRMELHKAPHYKGVDYCGKCGTGTRDPYLEKYKGNNYWTCECGKFNFIN
jgi:hypothetical protein